MAGIVAAVQQCNYLPHQMGSKAKSQHSQKGEDEYVDPMDQLVVHAPDHTPPDWDEETDLAIPSPASLRLKCRHHEGDAEGDAPRGVCRCGELGRGGHGRRCIVRARVVMLDIRDSGRGELRVEGISDRISFTRRVLRGIEFELSLGADVLVDAVANDDSSARATRVWTA